MQALRRVPRMWYVCGILGIAAAAGVAVFPGAPQHAFFVGLLSGAIAVATLGLALALRARLEGQTVSCIDARKRRSWYLAHGCRFLAWFSGHNLVWITLAVVFSGASISALGRHPLILSVAAGLLSCAMFTLAGIWWNRKPLTLGVCWPLDLHRISGYWSRGCAALRIQDRFSAAQRLDRHAFYRRLVAMWARDDSDETLQGAVRLMPPEEPPAAAFRLEFRSRFVSLLVPFLAVFLLSIPLFYALQRPLDDFALAMSARDTLVAQNAAADEGPQDSQTSPGDAGRESDRQGSEGSSDGAGDEGGSEGAGEGSDASSGDRESDQTADNSGTGEANSGSPNDGDGSADSEGQEQDDGENGSASTAGSGDGEQESDSGESGDEHQSSSEQEGGQESSDGEASDDGQTSDSSAGDETSAGEGSDAEPSEGTNAQDDREGNEPSEPSNQAGSEQQSGSSESPAASEDSGAAGEAATGSEADGGADSSDGGEEAGPDEQTTEEQAGQDQQQTDAAASADDQSAPPQAQDPAEPQDIQQESVPQTEVPSGEPLPDKPGPRIDLEIPAMTATGADSEEQPLEPQGDALKSGSPRFVPQRSVPKSEPRPLQWIPNWIIDLLTDFWPGVRRNMP